MASYTLDKTETAFNDAFKDINELYNANCINWKGKTSDNEYYSEIFAKKLLENDKLNKFEEIKEIHREKGYYVGSHHKNINQNIEFTNRLEEILAKILCFKEILIPSLGKVIDYQVPLKNVSNDKAGKIDIITYNIKQNELYLVEFKTGCNGDTLLKTALEIYTYSKILHIETFKNNLKDKQKYNISTKPNIKKAILVSKGTQAYKEYAKLSEDSKLKELITKKLNIEVSTIHVDPITISFANDISFTFNESSI